MTYTYKEYIELYKLHNRIEPEALYVPINSLSTLLPADELSIDVCAEIHTSVDRIAGAYGHFTSPESEDAIHAEAERSWKRVKAVWESQGRVLDLDSLHASTVEIAHSYVRGCLRLYYDQTLMTDERLLKEIITMGVADGKAEVDLQSNMKKIVSYLPYRPFGTISPEDIRDALYHAL